ncbi:hypothetical protein FRC12_005651 [Ceratobasidium sp. 428]|nr:hypothetical protein FRC12_005651 [Ceratobasidium sp. 428]
MAAASQSKWGPPLKEYLDRPEASLVFPELVGEFEISSAIDAVLNNPAAVTYRTLETFTAVIYRPAMLKVLINKRSVPSCMHILKTYAARNGSTHGNLLEHAFGFLGVHVLSLVLQAGLLQSFPLGLDRFPRILSKDAKCAWDVQAPALHDQYSQTFLKYFTDGMGFDQAPSPSNWQVEWCKGTRGDERACLPVIGGFAYRDAEFVLNQLFEHRDAFLECGFRTRAPGWSIIILVTQFLLDDRWLNKPSVPDVWKKQYDIAFRYSLISPARADTFLELVCGRFTMQYAKNPQQFASYTTAVNQGDAELVHLTYARKFRPNKAKTHKSADMSWVISITDYTRDTVTGYASLEASLVEITLEITWDALFCIGNPGDERWEVLDVFLGKNFGWKAKALVRKNQPDLVTAIIMHLHKLDFINMLGRYLLIVPYLKNYKPYVLQLTNFTITPQGYAAIQLIGEALGKAVYQASTLRPLLDEYYPDWHKTLRFLQMEKGRYSRNSNVYSACLTSEAAWIELGNHLAFTNHLKPTSAPRRCMYARCADPDDARFEGRDIRYCSLRCRAAYVKTVTQAY